MWWLKKQEKKRGKRVGNARQNNRRRLRFEGLEDRRLLAAGVVDVQVFPTLAPGRLDLVGDGSNNEVATARTTKCGSARPSMSASTVSTA